MSKKYRDNPEKRDRRRAEALARQTDYNSLTPTQKLARLDRLGHRALKERARLQKKLDAA